MNQQDLLVPKPYWNYNKIISMVASLIMLYILTEDVNFNANVTDYAKKVSKLGYLLCSSMSFVMILLSLVPPMSLTLRASIETMVDRGNTISIMLVVFCVLSVLRVIILYIGNEDVNVDKLVLAIYYARVVLIEIVVAVVAYFYTALEGKVPFN